MRFPTAPDIAVSGILSSMNLTYSSYWGWAYPTLSGEETKFVRHLRLRTRPTKTATRTVGPGSNPSVLVTFHRNQTI